MQTVSHHAVEELAVLIRKLAVDIQKADLLAIGQARGVLIDLGNRWQDSNLS